MITNVLISRHRRNGSSMSRLKVDLHHSRNLVGIRRSRDSSNASGIEDYYLVKSILISRGQGRTERPCEWRNGTRTRISESVGRIAGLKSRHIRGRMRGLSPGSKINKEMEVLVPLQVSQCYQVPSPIFWFA